MLYGLKRLCAIIRSVNLDTHLWCVSVIGGAVLLCISFFAEPSPGRLVALADDAKNLAEKKVIEYSSVLGGLSKIESLEEDEVVELAQVIPDHIDTFIGGEPSATTEVFDADFGLEMDTEADPVATSDAMVDVTNVYSAEAIDALERLVQCEAATEDTDGKTLVASVVLNRVDTGIWFILYRAIPLT